jgi:hypothetical protein
MPEVPTEKKSTVNPTPLAPLSIPECPNWWIHAYLFCPTLTANSNKKLLYAL